MADPVNNATRLRAIIERIGTRLVETLRPRDAYGTVLSLNPEHTALVRLNGPDQAEVTLPFGTIFPSVGDVVRIEGPQGDRYITDIAQQGNTSTWAILRQRFGSPAAQTLGAGQDGTPNDGGDITASRSGHVHPMTASTPVALVVGGSNATGGGTAPASALHTHAVQRGAPSNITVGNVAASGSSANFAGADHQHNVSIDSTDTSTSGTTLTAANNTYQDVGPTLALGAGTYILFAKGAVDFSIGAGVQVTWLVQLYDGTNELDNCKMSGITGGCIGFGLLDKVTFGSSVTIKVRMQRDNGAGTQIAQSIKIMMARIA